MADVGVGRATNLIFKARHAALSLRSERCASVSVLRCVGLTKINNVDRPGCGIRVPARLATLPPCFLDLKQTTVIARFLIGNAHLLS